ncbi:MAG: hypothetical protein V2A63_04270 [Patescibacteria group bacterium]
MFTTKPIKQIAVASSLIIFVAATLFFWQGSSAKNLTDDLGNLNSVRVVRIDNLSKIDWEIKVIAESEIGKQ